MADREEDNIDIVEEDDINSEERQEARTRRRKLLQLFKDGVINKLANTKFGMWVSGKATKIKTYIKAHMLPLIVVIVIAVCYIGFIAYFLYMPGFVRGKLEEFFSEGIHNLETALYGTNMELSGENIDKEKRIQLLQYLTDMGIDVVGYGFAPGVTYSKNEEGKEVISDYTTNLMSAEDNDDTSSSNLDMLYRAGLKIIGADSNVVKPNGDLLYYYLMANERAFVRKGNGVLGTLFGLDRSRWSGMLDIKGDEGIDGIESSVDRDKQVLTITRNRPLIDEDGLHSIFDEYVYSFPLDGWTGRFGMPVEFSLALHLATMSSGMVQEMLTNEDLQTTVTIGLQEVECTLNFRFNIKNDDGSVRELSAPYKDVDGNMEKLRDKIANGEEITEDDISIEGLYTAYKFLNMNKYQVVPNPDKLLQFDESSTYTLMGIGNISRHLETMQVIFDDKDLAVQVGNDFTATSDGKTEFEIGDIEIPVFYRKDDGTSNTGNLTRIDITANSGAYVCQYKDSSNYPNTATGKLNAATIIQNTSNTVRAKYERTEETDEYTEYKLKAIDEDGNEVNYYTDLYEYAPKGNKYQKNGQITYYRIHGLNRFTEKDELTMADLVYLRQNKDAYDAMFEEIDWFMSLAIWCNDWDLANFNYGSKYTSMDKINQFYGSDDEQRYLSSVTYYRNLFDEAIAENDLTQVRAKLLDIAAQINSDYETVKNGSVSLDTAKDEIEHVLEKINCKELTEEVVTFLYEQFANSVNQNGTVVKYVQPYILSVVKHWFKDIDFSKAYGSSETPVELEFPSSVELPDTIEVVSVLTPKDGQSLNVQTSQPFVVKGDVVLLDGEKVDKSELNDIKNVTDDIGDYQWGDGYRATKKIFTQGYYYSYDGSAETAKSVYYQQELENATGGEAYQFRVINGRISSASKLDESVASFDNLKVGEGAKELYNDDGIELYHLGQGKRNSDSATVDFYIIRVRNNALSYISPVKTDYATVRSRVGRINAIWQLAGIKCYRTHLTFDSVVDNENENGDEAATAQVMAATGLSILKNTKTEDAELIYRDLKEMLIELGYYTEAEFDYLDTDVLEWFIPDYRPSVWPQNDEQDAYNFSATIYPKEKKEEDVDTDTSGEITDEEQLRINLGLVTDKSNGFEPSLDVIAPGDCIIVNAKDNEIEIEFRADEEPEIAILDRYSMIIKGINIEDGIVITDEEGNETIVSYQSAIADKTKIPVHSVIGKTGEEPITVILLNSNGGLVSNIEHYMAPDAATVNTQTEEFCITGTVLTKDEFTNCCLSYMSANGIHNNDFSPENLRRFYEICVDSGVNPEFVFVKALSESGNLMASEATSTHNYWGYNTPNGSTVPSYGTMLETLQLVCNLIVSYQDPTTGNYNMIMEKYNERSTYVDPDMGPCNPNGYGLPTTLAGVQSIYSDLGAHYMDGPGDGGKYYLDPARHGGSAIVYSTHEEYVTKCLNVHDQMSDTTPWEKSQYTAWQCQKQIDMAREIFGDNAGKAMY